MLGFKGGPVRPEDVFAKMEGISLVIVRDFPFFGQGRLHFELLVELSETAHDVEQDEGRLPAMSFVPVQSSRLAFDTEANSRLRVRKMTHQDENDWKFTEPVWARCENA